MSGISGNSSRPIKRTKSFSTVTGSFQVSGGSFNNDKTVSHTSNTQIERGMTVTASGGVGSGVIPDGAFVQSVVSNVQFELNVATTGGSHAGASLTFSAGSQESIQEVGQRTKLLDGTTTPSFGVDEVTVNGADSTAAHTALYNIIHAAGSNNPFKSGDTSSPPTADANLLSGCKVYKVVDDSGATVTEYWRAYLYTADDHGLPVGSGSTIQNLVDSRLDATGSMYAVGASFTVRPFMESLRVLENFKDADNTYYARCNLGGTRGGYAVIVGPATIGGGVLNGLFDVQVSREEDLPLAGEEIVMPAGIDGATMNVAAMNLFMYYVLDEDNIVLYTDLVINDYNLVLENFTGNNDPTVTHNTNTSVHVGMKVGTPSGGSGTPSMPANAFVSSVTNSGEFELNGATSGGSFNGMSVILRRRRLQSAEDRTFGSFGRNGGGADSADDFAEVLTGNPTSLAITNSTSSPQVIQNDINMIEFFATGGDTTITLGLHKNLTSTGYVDNAPDFTITSLPVIIVPQNTRVQVPINTSRYGAFTAKSSAANDTLYWNFLVG